MKENGLTRTKTLKSLRTKLFIRFFASLILTAALFTVVFSLNAIAADEPLVPVTNFDIADSPTAVNAANPDATLAPETSALFDLIGVDASQPLEILLLITIISIAPSILLMMTCFTRVVIVMSFLRNAMQTQQTPPNQVVISLALFLTMFLMWPVFMQVNEVAYKPYENGEITTWEAVERAGGPIKVFMLKQTSRSTMAFFLNLADVTIYTSDTFGTDNPVPVDVNTTESNLDEFADQFGFEVAIPAFMISELSRAFIMGFMLFIPFLIIDIVVASTLMSMGMMMLPPAMISMPFKLMLFILVDGWQMVVGSIAASFNP